MTEFHLGNITLRSTTGSDLPDLLALWNDGRVMQWVGFPEGLGYDYPKLTRWFRQLQTSPHRHHFVVQSDTLGFCGETYYQVDSPHRRAGLDIKLIPQAQGQGIATKALGILIRRVFDTEPEVEAVWTEPAEKNVAARRLYARCGLQPAGRPKDMKPFDSYWELRREKAGNPGQ